jgi:hypothetical protein
LQEWRSPEEERVYAKFRRPRHNELWEIAARSEQADHPIHYHRIKEERRRVQAEEEAAARAELMQMIEEDKERRQVLAEAKRPYTAPSSYSPRRIGRSDSMRLSRINDDLVLEDVNLEDDEWYDPREEARAAREAEEQKEQAKLNAQDAEYNKDKGLYARGRGGGAGFYSKGTSAMGFTREQLSPKVSYFEAVGQPHMHNRRPSWWG